MAAPSDFGCSLVAVQPVLRSAYELERASQNVIYWRYQIPPAIILFSYGLMSNIRIFTYLSHIRNKKKLSQRGRKRMEKEWK